MGGGGDDNDLVWTILHVERLARSWDAETL